jgi:hypothetical protein
MDFNTLSIGNLSIIYKNNKDHFKGVTGFSKMKKQEKLEVIKSVDSKLLNMSLKLVKKEVKEKKVRPATFNTLFIKYFNAKKYESKLKENNSLDEKNVMEIITNDLQSFTDSLELSMIKKQVDKYGLLKALMQYNNKKENKQYLLQVLGGKSNYSEKLEEEIYRKLLPNVIMQDDDICKKLLKSFKKYQEKDKVSVKKVNKSNKSNDDNDDNDNNDDNDDNDDDDDDDDINIDYDESDIE